MTNSSTHKRAMRQYLLGQVSQEERAAFENQYLENGELFEELMAAENELIGSYLSETCSESERSRIELHLLPNSEWRESVKFSRSHLRLLLGEASFDEHEAGPLQARHDKSASGDLPQALLSRALPLATRRYAQPALWLVLILTTSWVLISNLQLRQRLDKQSVEQNDVRRQLEVLRGQEAKLQTDLQKAQLGLVNQSDRATLPPFSRSKTIVLTLASDLVRKAGGNEPPLILRDATLVRLQLELGTDIFPSYAATLGTPEGVVILQNRNLKSQMLRGGKHYVILTVLGAKLERGTYAVKLSGMDMRGQEVDLPSYAFHVER